MSTRPAPAPASPGRPGGAPDTGAPDTEALRAWLTAQLPGGAPAAALSVSRLTGGLSNLTYLVDWGADRVVIRRPPLGHVLETAHDMGREYRLLTALAPTSVPVPRPYGLCQDPGVIGAPFYAMSWVPGETFRGDAQLAALGGPDAALTTHALVDTLAELHAVDPDRVGLGDFGRPQGFMARQVRRWRRQWEQSRTRQVPGADELNDRLAAGCPTRGGVALVHGDYKLDNLLFDPARPGRINAVLDWEMSTLGDPLADLGMLCMYWEGFSGVAHSPVATPADQPHWPGRRDLLERYAARSGRPLDEVGWYTAFAYYKIAAILEGIHCRVTQGLADGQDSRGVAAAVPLLIERGHAALSDPS